MVRMSGRAGAGGATAGRYPFTASQCQELEHQALTYKCLASGKPIPSYLMPPLRRISRLWKKRKPRPRPSCKRCGALL